MAVDRPDAAAGLLRDLPDGSIHTRGDVHRLGRFKQRVEVAPCVGAQPLIRPGAFGRQQEKGRIDGFDFYRTR